MERVVSRLFENANKFALAFDASINFRCTVKDLYEILIYREKPLRLLVLLGMEQKDGKRKVDIKEFYSREKLDIDVGLDIWLRVSKNAITEVASAYMGKDILDLNIVADVKYIHLIVKLNQYPEVLEVILE